MCFLKGKHELMRDKQFPGFLGTITVHPVAGVLFKVFIVTIQNIWLVLRRKCLVSKIVRFADFYFAFLLSTSSFILKLTE